LVSLLGFRDASEAWTVVLGVGVSVVSLSAKIVGGWATVGARVSLLAVDALSAVLAGDSSLAVLRVATVRAVTLSLSVGAANTLPEEITVSAASIALDTKAVDITVALAAVESSTTVGTSEAGAVFAFIARITAVFTLAIARGERLALLVVERSAVNLVLRSVVSRTSELSTSSDSSASHDTLTIAELELGLLVTLLPLTLSSVALTAVASVDTNLLKGTIVLLAIVALTLSDTITMAIDTIGAVATKAMTTVVLWVSCSTIVLLRVPPSVAVVISVGADPLVDTTGGGMALLTVPVRMLLVGTVKSDCGSVSHLFTLGVILNNFPVLLDGDIDVSKLDLSLLALLNLGEFLPLN